VTPRQQRRAARARLAVLKREARARVSAMPEVQRARRKRARRRRALLTALLLLLLLFLRCDCEPGAPSSPEAVVLASVDAGVKAVPPRLVKRKPSTDRLASSARPPWELGAQRGPAWLDDFRMQVAARSPRLALCFTGADRPGALRWNVALNPESGATSDHLVEPIGSADLTGKQRECVLKTLSTPGYRIAEADRESVPSRVSLVIEF
jgi:hypothetical protein